MALPIPRRGMALAFAKPLGDLRRYKIVGIGYAVSMPQSEYASMLAPSNVSGSIIVRCHIAEACLGGPESRCGDGYTARRCGQCADGWFSYVGSCLPCGSGGVAPVLNVVAVLVMFLIGLFILWQLMLDPRVASPFVFLMRLLETLAILKRTSIDWPPAVRDAFALASLVNFNTEIFRFECTIGHPDPLSRVVTAALFPFISAVAFILAWPLIRALAKMRSKMHPVPASLSNLESMCAKLRPDAPPAQKRGPLGFRPTDALVAASFFEYLQILSAVLLLARCA